VIRGEGKDGNPVLAVVGPEGGRVAALPTEDCVKNPHIVISPEGDRLAYPTKSGQLRIVQTAGGDGTTVPTAFLERSDTLVQWNADGHILYVAREGQLPLPIDQIELSTGRRSAWKTLAPADPLGIRFAGGVLISRDAQSYAYSSSLELSSDLYIVEGVK
jgi:hypothetical protein